MNCLSKDIVQLEDLPDELILTIMNKVKPQVLLLCSIITVGNNRLEQLALDKCHSIDLTFAYQSVYDSLIQRFYLHVMPRIINNIQSLTLDILQIPRIIAFAEQNCNGTLPNLTHLKMICRRRCPKSDTHFTLSNRIYNILRRKPLFSIVPQYFPVDKTIREEILYTVRSSLFMRSIVSFELDDNCILPDIFNNYKFFFHQSIQLTHIRITLCVFDDCVDLLNRLGSQLYSFSVNIVYTCSYTINILSKIRLISCPCLKQLTITNYRNMCIYEQCFVHLLQRFSNVEYLTLLLAIDLTMSSLNHFIDGFDLEKDFLSYMPYLKQFHFHIRSVLKFAPRVQIDTIRQSFMKQLLVDCTVDYFNSEYGQSHIYSLPFIGTRLDFISNRFPLFDIDKTFSMVTILLLFDDFKPFESVFFKHISQALPHLRTLEVFNELEQQEKTISVTNNIEFAHLSTLILFDSHMDYGQQLLCRTHLPSLNELAIHRDILLPIIAQDHQQARDNCSKVEALRILETLDVVDTIVNFFPVCSHLKC